MSKEEEEVKAKAEVSVNFKVQGLPKGRAGTALLDELHQKLVEVSKMKKPSKSELQGAGSEGKGRKSDAE